MRCSLRQRFAGLIVLAGTIALLQTGCSTEPTANETAEPTARPSASTASGFTLVVGGPDSIWTTAYYNFGAHWSAPYPTLIWYTRSCATLKVATCAGAWNLAADVSYDGSATWTLTRRLVYDCSGGGTKSFQNKVVASGFGVPAQTVYKITKLCGQNPV